MGKGVARIVSLKGAVTATITIDNVMIVGVISYNHVATVTVCILDCVVHQVALHTIQSNGGWVVGADSVMDAHTTRMLVHMFISKVHALVVATAVKDTCTGLNPHHNTTDLMVNLPLVCNSKEELVLNVPMLQLSLNSFVPALWSMMTMLVMIEMLSVMESSLRWFIMHVPMILTWGSHIQAW